MNITWKDAAVGLIVMVFGCLLIVITSVFI